MVRLLFIPLQVEAPRGIEVQRDGVSNPLRIRRLIHLSEGVLVLERNHDGEGPVGFDGGHVRTLKRIKTGDRLALEFGMPTFPAPRQGQIAGAE